MLVSEWVNIITDDIMVIALVMMYMIVALFSLLACVWNLRKKQYILYGFNIIAHMIALTGALYVSGISFAVAVVLFVVLFVGSIILQHNLYESYIEENKKEEEENQTKRENE